MQTSVATSIVPKPPWWALWAAAQGPQSQKPSRGVWSRAPESGLELSPARPNKTA